MSTTPLRCRPSLLLSIQDPDASMHYLVARHLLQHVVSCLRTGPQMHQCLTELSPDANIRMRPRHRPDHLKHLSQTAPLRHPAHCLHVLCQLLDRSPAPALSALSLASPDHSSSLSSKLPILGTMPISFQVDCKSSFNAAARQSSAAAGCGARDSTGHTERPVARQALTSDAMSCPLASHHPAAGPSD